MLTIDDVWPAKATYRPGEEAMVRATLALQGDSSHQVTLDWRVRLLTHTLERRRDRVVALPGETSVTFTFTLPSASFRGYGIDLDVSDAQGAIVATASTALDALDAWPQAPRYGFLSDFAPADPHAGTAVDTLARYHVNVVQFYDWMWRHYALMPPTDEFTDALGRTLSLRTTRAKARTCRDRGMAALGYAAVYGAEPVYALEHPDEMLYASDGTPYSLDGLFYIMNIHRGNPWRDRILAEMARAVRETPFDGLHLDQYGFPRDEAFGPQPRSTPYDLATDFPPFIDDARAAARAARRDARVIFNAVDNWPIETVAPTQQDATYIEVWPPFDDYGDLQTLILEARHLAPDKQVILAAYLTPLKGAVGDGLPPAEAATRLASAAIWANGGFHLLMGEHNGALCDAYYPAYAAMRPEFARVMRGYYDFVVRYENLLSDPRLFTLPNDEAAAVVRVGGHPASPFGEAGLIWTMVRRMPHLLTVSLINLTDCPSAAWNTPQPPPVPLTHLDIEVRTDAVVQDVFVASPDSDHGRPISRPYHATRHDGHAYVRLSAPRLAYWSLVVVRTAPTHS